MMYLIKKNGIFSVNASDLETIKKYGGVDARIIYSWEEDKQEEALKKYFSSMKMDSNTLELYTISGIKKEELLKYIDKYYEEDNEILSMLTDIELITSREKEELSIINKESKKEQVNLVHDCYFNNPIKKYMK